jgi:hypothetical protein
MANDFRPTHRITFTPTDGPSGPALEPKTWEVMLWEDDNEAGDGSAYTQEEWDETAMPAWYVTRGRWYCEGEATPGGRNGLVKVELL